MSDRPQWAREGADWPNRGASRFLEVGRRRWHVQVAGAGPVALLLHGTGAATHSWRDVLPILARDWTVVAPDLPGHGFSDPPRDRTLPGVARGVAALMAALGLTADVIAGHSAGAAVACRMALDGPAPGRIVSFGGALLPFPGLAAKLFPAMARLIFDNALTPRLFALQARLPGQVGSFLDRSTGSRLDARGIELYGRLFATAGHCAGALGMMSEWDLAALRHALPGLPCPMTLAVGGRDAAVPAGVAREVAAIVPRADVVTWPALGHLMHEERPELAAELIGRVAVAA